MTPARLILPPSAQPTHRCEICGAGAYSADELTRHVKKCARKNRDKLEQLAHLHRTADPLHGATDQEAVDFQVKRYGRS